MKTLTDFRDVLAEKLLRTNSLDEAFSKAVWMAYNEGLLAGLTTENPENIVVKTAEILKKGYGAE